MLSDKEIIEIAQNIYKTEIDALINRREKISENFIKAARKILECKGKVVLTGIGKTGIIARKISATLASTGTTSAYMNSTEGLHGDLGLINKEDIVIAISNSGESGEISAIIPAIKNIGAYIIAMTGNINSSLAKVSDLVLDTHVDEEGCPLNLAPMASTTSALVMGDALAGCLMKLRDFSPQNFAMYHPGGSLGRKLLTRVKNLMKSGESLAICAKESGMDEVVILMNDKKLGIVCVMESQSLVGIITEGDIRRALKHKENFFSLKAKDIMTVNYTKIDKEAMATDALSLMEDRPSQINVLPVFDMENFIGIIRIHDLVKVK
ncbi:MAG: KpsF/GutQ family sugar-phosphate isomerase [Fusobacterium gastrosuis]|uniref:KpsF/GutQ family sugar-phosphate isomerase n=1 Tax=Fusobacterium gastrosuis TaxID=1755100 RepID=UPI002A981193|nr:KpsF/GutQ family sugar-phosphate isomerase [Fusobacteriaceae bacterium]MDY5795670.1 KpsF/GutQ family sugar-phosphate isomerase [Fusobacterium gastrosuis]